MDMSEAHRSKLQPLALTLTVAGAVARLFPHPPNFAPVGGMSLFAGARIRGWQAYLLPVLLMAVTDPLVGGYSRLTPFIYASFLMNVWIGRWLASTENPIRIGAAALICSAQFYLVSNFAVWLMGHYFPHTLAGLADCYIVALPFFGRTLAGDLMFTAILFGLHAWLSRTIRRNEPVPAR